MMCRGFQQVSKDYVGLPIFSICSTPENQHFWKTVTIFHVVFHSHNLSHDLSLAILGVEEGDKTMHG